MNSSNDSATAETSFEGVCREYSRQEDGFSGKVITFSCIMARISHDTNYDILLLAYYQFTNDILVLFLVDH